MRRHETGSAVASLVSIPYTRSSNQRAPRIGQSITLEAVLPTLADLTRFDFERHQKDESER